MSRPAGCFLRLVLAAMVLTGFQVRADADIQLTGVPDYNWFAGCFGTATGNLMGYWDRNGFPDFYTGPTAKGVAPLNNCGTNIGIRSMWATKAGLDGRPANLPGHIDDYWASYSIVGTCGTSDAYSYESTATDRYLLLNRPEHVPDCIGDFIGLSQKHWTNMNNECDGDIDAYSFVYWETNGSRRVNYTPPPQGTNAGKDIPSGLRAWTRYRGYDADTVSQLVAFNPNCPPGQGFAFEDLRTEIDAGYPVLAFMQSYTVNSRSLSGMPKANPAIHGMLIYGYQISDSFGTNVYVRDSWGGGERTRPWSPVTWVDDRNLPLRGLIGYHPKPRMRSISISGADVTITWDGPSSALYDDLTGATTAVHFYQLEKSSALNPASFQPVGAPTSERTITIPDCCGDAAFYRVQLLP